MSFNIKLGNFLYQHAYGIYKPLYSVFKTRQDAQEIALLEKHVFNGAVVLDIGANIGFYAGILSRLVGEKGSVHCFEPDLRNFSRLKQTLTGLQNVVLNNVAVGPRTERINIYTSSNLNVDHRTYKPEEYDEELEVEAVAIDDYLARVPGDGTMKKVDFIKIDIQGFEMQAMKGMERTLSENADVKIISEFWPHGLKKAGSSASEYYDFLCGRGFSCYLLEKRALTRLDAQAVRSLEPLGEHHDFDIGEKHSFNILALRSGQASRV